MEGYHQVYKLLSGICGVIAFIILAIGAAIMQLVPSLTLAKWTALPEDEYFSETMYY